MRFTTIASAALCFVCLAPFTRADVKLPAIIGDHMVLQRDQKVPLWGWADPGEKVTVTAGDNKAEATAGPDGKWQVALNSLKASDQPIDITVGGKNTITIKDVLVGDVWVASGQSNMEFQLGGGKWGFGGDFRADEEIPKANHPTLRLFVVRHKLALEPQTDCTGSWMVCTPDTAPKFSAVGYFFGRAIMDDQKVPVGMIGTYWGGTVAQAWTSIEALDAMPATKGLAEQYRRAKEGFTAMIEKYEKETLPAWQAEKAKWDEEVGKGFAEQLAAWQKEVDAAKAEGKPAPPRPQPSRPEPRRPQDPRSAPNQVPSSLYNGMLTPIIPFAIKGVIWYQGESNAGLPVQYQTLFPGMITDWRTRWGEGEFPFIWVQLANYMKRQDEPTQSAGGWPGLREAQSKTLSLPKTGQAVIIDIGDGADIHPRDKMDVGKRLSLVARHVAYGEELVYSGPMYDTMKVDGDKVRVTFKHTGGGLTIGAPPATRPSDQPTPAGELKGFAICGADKKFVWADAKIDGSSVIVSSPDVKEPIAVRYAYDNNPVCNLYNKEGLPASPFRTDDFVDAPPATKPAK